MATYFGHNVNETTENTGNADYILWNLGNITEAVCPGSGSQNVSELTAYVKAVSITTAHLRVGIYNAAGTTLLAYTGSIVISSTSPSWVGATTSGGITWASGTALTGGTSYLLCVHFENSDTILYQGTHAGTYGYGYEGSHAYASGLPATIPETNWDYYVMCIRCGVDPALNPLQYTVADALSASDGIAGKFTFRANIGDNLLA